MYLYKFDLTSTRSAPCCAFSANVHHVALIFSATNAHHVASSTCIFARDRRRHVSFRFILLPVPSQAAALGWIKLHPVTVARWTLLGVTDPGWRIPAFRFTAKSAALLTVRFHEGVDVALVVRHQGSTILAYVNAIAKSAALPTVRFHEGVDVALVVHHQGSTILAYIHAISVYVQ